MTSHSQNVTIALSPELANALEAEAYSQDATRAAVARKILADRLRELGHLSLSAPPTVQLGQSNRRYRAWGRRV